MLEKLRKMISEQFNIDESEINEDTNLKEDLGADSLDLFELVIALEDEYDMEISEDDAFKLNTISDVMEYIKNKGLE